MTEINDDFIALVEEMRKAQKDYFRNRSYTLLNMAKRLEREVDSRIRDLREGKKTPQGSLFG